MVKYDAQKQRYVIGDECLSECQLDYYTDLYAKDSKCITQSVALEEKFFFSLEKYFRGNIVEQSKCFGHLTQDGPTFILNINGIFSGSHLYPDPNDSLFVTPFAPDNIFFAGIFPRSILTSDGVITLEQDQFIGVKDGLIEELDVQEVLDIISKGQAEKSPLFSSLRLNPVAKRPARPRKGTLIYNKNNNTIEVYNGQEWKEV